MYPNGTFKHISSVSILAIFTLRNFQPEILTPGILIPCKLGKLYPEEFSPTEISPQDEHVNTLGLVYFLKIFFQFADDNFNWLGSISWFFFLLFCGGRFVRRSFRNEQFVIILYLFLISASFNENLFLWKSRTFKYFSLWQMARTFS